MNINNNRNNAHSEVDRVFKKLFPTRNMAERPAQVALSHQMLDAMLEGGIALCDSKALDLIQRYDSPQGCAFGRVLGAYSETITKYPQIP